MNIAYEILKHVWQNHGNWENYKKTTSPFVYIYYYNLWKFGGNTDTNYIMTRLVYNLVINIQRKPDIAHATCFAHMIK